MSVMLVINSKSQLRRIQHQTQLSYPSGAADPDVVWFAVINGHCQSKSNSRFMKWLGPRGRRKPFHVKSDAAMKFREEMLWQLKAYKNKIPELFITDFLFDEDLSITCRIYYPSERNDLDSSLVYDCLQEGGIVKNDRQFKEQHTYRFTDRERPRVEVELRRI